MKLSRKRIEELKETARICRRDILRMTTLAGSGHPGGSLSCIDILVTLFFGRMRHNPRQPKWEGRDRFFLSKGHCCPALYAVLSRAGYFPVEELDTLRKLNSILQGHPDMLYTPGVEVSSGSLGQGLSIGNGVALAAKVDHSDIKVYIMLGDGECQEGMVWEAAMTSAQHKLDNLCAFVDYNRLQIDGWIDDIKSLEPLQLKWESFGWKALIIDGHSFEEIWEGLMEADRTKDKPTVCIARTVKGKGVTFMENQAKYHGMALTPEELGRALKELE